ncbi:DUF1189 family protein [Salimicrobium halophilum]|uniref:DUF1189 domain-containing protein n=1 Tax=Salimicrobium halophilum TaxID=86666 RepID=A0A1G8WQS7_9BACI|nr:DUF1189 family protein [Salimicrobium halophilum]SDJ80407.1 Protein of unknown function [Salimicrobium halophilum]
MESLKLSLRLPRKDALFQLNRKGITSTIGYLFVLLLVLFIPNIYNAITTFERELTEVSRGLYMAQALVFYPLLIIFLIIAGVSILAGGGLFLSKLLKRKLRYQQLWKMTAYALTLPLTFSTVSTYIGVSEYVTVLLFFVPISYLLYKMITVYPKRS